MHYPIFLCVCHKYAFTISVWTVCVCVAKTHQTETFNFLLYFRLASVVITLNIFKHLDKKINVFKRNKLKWNKTTECLTVTFTCLPFAEIWLCYEKWFKTTGRKILFCYCKHALQLLCNADVKIFKRGTGVSQE